MAAIAKPEESLGELLHRLGFAAFRPAQEAVCRSVAGGEDALVVMPTGAGKSLCYQLPGLARGGTTLVISPLIALMEDQVAKLQERGLRAERIHSGRDRQTSREVCFAYLRGELDFLFIAPERLRVQGFPEMLAKRRLSLIAVDEAHCISQWGHDFRPDYRMIGQRLPAFRPTPVIALTATATPIVQDDIVNQLGLGGQRYIQGFRRDNLAIEVVETPQGARSEKVEELLLEAERRPAIVYTPTRKEAEALAASLGLRFPAAAYHAGLDARHRDHVQTRFLESSLEVVVATIAFGMGIDKPDIRTVIHTALPGSVESYYQEIGRAGRDGEPSRAILLQSYSDRRTHDFFFERDYPEPKILAKLFACLGAEPQPKQILAMRMKMDEESFDGALEKLWIHGGALVDYAEMVQQGDEGWVESYQQQRDQKLAQLDQILRFARCSQCRMTALVQHFGDRTDTRGGCGICDFCAPDECVAQSFRRPSANESEAALEVLQQLERGGTGSGKLFQDAGLKHFLDRNAFENLLGGLARAGYVVVTESSFEKDGARIEFRKVSLTPEGRRVTGPTDLKFALTEGRKPSSRKRQPKSPAPAHAESADPKVVAALRAWRLEEARRQSIPAFRILSDRSLNAIAAAKPRSTNELLAIQGLGLKAAEKYGAAIFRILHKA